MPNPISLFAFVQHSSDDENNTQDVQRDCYAQKNGIYCIEHNIDTEQVLCYNSTKHRGFPPPDVYFDIVLIASTTSTIKLRIAVISSIMSVALCILSPLFFFFRLLNALTSFLYIVKGFSAFSLKNYIFRGEYTTKKDEFTSHPLIL